MGLSQLLGSGNRPVAANPYSWGKTIDPTDLFGICRKKQKVSKLIVEVYHSTDYQTGIRDPGVGITTSQFN